MADEDRQYQNSGIVNVSDDLASDAPPPPRLVDNREETERKKKQEARAQKFGKIAFWLAVVVIVPHFLISVGILSSLNVKTLRWIVHSRPILITDAVLGLSCLIAFFISLLGWKTKYGRRALWLSLTGFLMPWLVIWGIPWLLTLVGIHIRYQ